jgi:hypothetical protein
MAGEKQIKQKGHLLFWSTATGLTPLAGEIMQQLVTIDPSQRLATLVQLLPNSLRVIPSPNISFVGAGYRVLFKRGVNSRDTITYAFLNELDRSVVGFGQRTIKIATWFDINCRWGVNHAISCLSHD